MLNRRNFIKYSLGSATAALGISGCADKNQALEKYVTRARDTVILYDTYAMALYFDGGLGPKTGIIKVDYILSDLPVELPFWHGHGGQRHRFTLTQQTYADLRSLKKTYVQTDEVASHSHKLFIDPTDPKWRVPGAQPVEVPIF